MALSPRRNSEFDRFDLEGPDSRGVYKARSGKGYFVVETSHGKSYVKEIQLIIDNDGYY